MRVTLNNITIDYEIAGPRTGIPIIFIHGFPFSKEIWKPQVEVLKNKFYVICYDVRGHGKSDVGDGQYTIEYFVDDLIGLLNHLRISKTVVVGLSMGGYIALRAIERSPERFRGLVLCSTRSESDNNDGKIRRAVQAQLVKNEGIKIFIESFLPAVLSKKTLDTKPEVVETIKRIIQQTSPLAIAGTQIALAARTDTTPALFNINVPTLILVGRDDTITPPSASQAMKAKIPNAELHVIKDAGHVINMENPQEFNKYLVDFLENLT